MTAAALTINPSITDWITALSTATLGLIGFIFAAWQWRASGFRPHLTARMDERREAIELRMQNKGRWPGAIERILVLRPTGAGESVVENVDFEGFDEGEFKPLSLPGLASARIIIQAKPGQYFPTNARLKVFLWRDRGKEVKLGTAQGVSLYGLKSFLPANRS
jgi:hypothetical protein